MFCKFIWCIDTELSFSRSFEKVELKSKQTNKNKRGRKKNKLTYISQHSVL